MRLDLLIQSFLRGVKRLQNSLSQNLDALEACASVIKSKMIALTILDQYDKADQLMTVVQILGKLNDEILVYQNRLKRKRDGNKTSNSLLSKKLQKLQSSLRTVIESNSPRNWEQFIDSVRSPPITSNLASRRPQKSPYPRNVTLLMPPNEIPVPISDSQMPQINGDKSDIYWSDDHHKFIKFPSKDWYTIIQENDLSYQNLHLVAPANYVTSTSPEYIAGASLPWLAVQDVSKDNFDILREDLERVLKRTRALQDKVWLAAELSVKVSGPKRYDFKEKRLSVSWHTHESVRGFSRESGRSEISAYQSSARRSSWTSASLPLAGNIHWKDESGNRDQQKLTRVNIYQNYPQLSNRWTAAVPDPFRCLAQKEVADQGNLLQKTKLRLFIPEKDRKKCDVKRDLISPDSVFSAQSYRGAPSSMRFINKLKSRGDCGITRLHKGRIEFLVDVGLKSKIDSDRADAAMSLSQLGALDPSLVVPALIDVVNTDSNSIVKLQASKALLSLGVCPANVIRVLIGCLLHGSAESQIEMLDFISNTQDVKSLFYECNNEKLRHSMIEILQEKSELIGAKEKLAFLAAMCLVDVCDVTDTDSVEKARISLKNIALFSDDKDSRAKSLEALTKSLDMCDEDIFGVILDGLQSASNWRHRLSAALLLAYLGPDRLEQWISEDGMYDIIRRKVWDDPKREVRLGVSQAATSLGMRSRLLEDFDQYLRDSDEELRSRAVIAMSAVGIHSDATLRYLNEMLELDDSDYVRLQIIRTYKDLNLTDIRAVRAVRERDRAGGPLGRAAHKFLSQHTNKSATPKIARRIRKWSPKRHRGMLESRQIPWTGNYATETPRKAGRLEPINVENNGSVTDANRENKRLTLTSTAIRRSALKPGTRLPLTGSSGQIIRA